MRPARLVTGAAASAVTIATLGLFAAGPAYAGDSGTLRADSAGTASRALTGGPGARLTDDEAPGDEAGSGPDSGSGTDGPFSLDTLSGLDAPSLLDSVGGGDAFSGLGISGGRDNPSGDEDTDRGQDSGRGQGTDRGEDSGGRDSSGGRDDSGGRDSSSGRDSSDGRESWNPSDEEGSGKHYGPSSGHDSSGGRDNSSSGHRPGDGPTGPTGHVKTGVGGSVRSDTTQIAAGAGVLAATAVGGAWLLRRRASGTQGAG
ncbi:hypothetical protein [Streptomyces sp. NPDC030920]|uniref:hypothetical protein n=1 Tax=Streptomyces sp. NPDC030920 TaxID=3365308 RepID=UPI00384AB492